MKKQKPKPQTVTIKVPAEAGRKLDAVLAKLRRDGISSCGFMWESYLKDRPLTKGGLVDACVAMMHFHLVIPPEAKGRG